MSEPKPCGCYEHCEDDDDNVRRRPGCLKRQPENDPSDKLPPRSPFEDAQKRAKAGENPQVVAIGYALATAFPSGSSQ